jgi:hypothetical protein
MPERRIIATLDARPRIAVDATLGAIGLPCFRKEPVGNVVGVDAERALDYFGGRLAEMRNAGRSLAGASGTASRSREELHIEGSAG